MTALNKPVAGDTDWTTEINSNWTTIEESINGGVLKMVPDDTSDSRTTSGLADDAYLNFAIGANETWQFEMVLFWSSTSATPDIKVGMNGPASPSFMRAHVQLWSRLADAPLNGGITLDYATTFQNDYTSAPDSIIVIRGAVINGSNSGTMALQWAQRVTNANPTYIKAGSYLMARRLT